MGYYTDYKLSIKRGRENDFENILSEVKEASGYHFEDDGTLYDSKWYDHEEHMKDVSKLYPDVVIELHGSGEENGDLWNKYFKDGKMQVCRGKVVYPEFDGLKLV